MKCIIAVESHMNMIWVEVSTQISESLLSLYDSVNILPISNLLVIASYSSSTDF